jgi:predicted Ser/Thr protein kinase
MGLLSNTSQDIPMLTYKKKEIIIENVLGQGGSSIVYKGLWEVIACAYIKLTTRNGLL